MPEEDSPIPVFPHKSFTSDPGHVQVRGTIAHVREPSKLLGSTSKFCPHCLEEFNENIKRKREYILIGPLRRNQCDLLLRVLEPRVSSRETWWNKGIIRWLIAPPEPPTENPWFESRPYAICPIHGREQIHELEGIRQFGRIRIWLIWIRGKIIHTLNWIIPIN